MARFTPLLLLLSLTAPALALVGTPTTRSLRPVTASNNVGKLSSAFAALRGGGNQASAPPPPPAPKAGIISAVLSLGAYAYFFLYFCAYWAFLVPQDYLKQYLPTAIVDLIPYKMESAPSGVGLEAILTDVALLAAWMIPHSFFARSSVKKSMGLGALERPFYIFQATALLHLIMHLWQNFAGPELWDVTHNEGLSKAILGFFLFGFLWLLSSTFAIDHFHLTGLTQGFGMDMNKMLGLSPAAGADGVVKRAHYSIVAHPIMMGMMIGCWATPVMTAPRLLFAVLNTLYMVYAVKNFEEPRLKEMIGPGYTEYLKTVPSFCPFAPAAM